MAVGLGQPGMRRQAQTEPGEEEEARRGGITHSRGLLGDDPVYPGLKELAKEGRSHEPHHRDSLEGRKEPTH